MDITDIRDRMKLVLTSLVVLMMLWGQSWHAAILNNLPVKYLLVDESGKTTLWLKKW
jgi:hypothetical protein